MVRRQPVARPTISMAPHLRMSAMCRTGPCLGASLVGRISAVSFQVRPRIFARRHVIWANGREAFADREHTGEIDSSRRWASREADPPVGRTVQQGCRNRIVAILAIADGADAVRILKAVCPRAMAG